MEDQNLYDTLGIPKDADTETIKKAFRRKAKQSHPDREKHPDSESDPEEFQAVVLAYTVLKNPNKRAEYDRTGRLGEACIDPENHLWSEATKKVTRIFSDILNQVGEKDILYTDIFRTVRQQLEDEIRQHKEDVPGWEKIVECYHEIKRRLFCKDANDFLGVFIEKQIQNANASIDQTKFNIKVNIKSLSLVDNYKFDFSKRTQEGVDSTYAGLAPTNYFKISYYGGV